MKQFKSCTQDEQSQIIDLYYDLFAGRLDTYAIRVEFRIDGEDKAAYMPSTYSGDKESVRDKIKKIVRGIGTPEFGPEAIRAHFDGRELLGAYPITPNNTVRWFALDFDGKDGDPWKAAVEQATVLATEAGLKVYIERSQSGNGYHVWGFINGEVNAGKLRHALSPFIEKVETYDRMFPNQNGLSETRPLGNLIALPMHGGRMENGNSSFVKRGDNGQPVPFADQFAFLSEIKLNDAQIFEDLFVAAGQYQAEAEATKHVGETEGLSDAWKMTHPRFGCEFWRFGMEHPEDVSEPLWYAMACNLAKFENGRALFHQWSRADSTRYSPRATDKKFDQAVKMNAPHTCETIRGLGGNCTCDQRFPGAVYHPFDIAKLPFKKLVEAVGVEGDLSHQVVTVEEGLDDAIERLEQIEKDPEAGQGRRYGIKSLDAATRKRNSDLIIIAARPGMGKTAFAGSTMDFGARDGEPQYFFSAEMSHKQFWMRQLSVISEVSQTRMVTGQLTSGDWAKIRNARNIAKDSETYPIFVDDMSRSTERIFEVAARLVHKHGKGTIWIDYLQLLQRMPRESMFDAVTRITHDLKLLAKALDCPVIALTQLNRTADDATSESQTNDSWLRGSGDIEQAADVIIFILGEKGPGVRDRDAALHKERHREGGIRIALSFNQPIMRFGERGYWSDTPQVVRRAAPPLVGAVADPVAEAHRAMNERLQEFARNRDANTPVETDTVDLLADI